MTCPVCDDDFGDDPHWDDELEAWVCEAHCQECSPQSTARSLVAHLSGGSVAATPPPMTGRSAAAGDHTRAEARTTEGEG